MVCCALSALQWSVCVCSLLTLCRDYMCLFAHFCVPTRRVLTHFSSCIPVRSKCDSYWASCTSCNFDIRVLVVHLMLIRVLLVTANSYHSRQYVTHSCEQLSTIFGNSTITAQNPRLMRTYEDFRNILEFTFPFSYLS